MTAHVALGPALLAAAEGVLLRDVRALEVTVQEDDYGHVYLTGMHFIKDAMPVIEAFVADTDYELGTVVKALDNGSLYYVHPALILAVGTQDDLAVSMRGEGVSRDPLPGWIPLIAGELP